MSRDARFETVTTDAGHHARFRARNGRIAWATETYIDIRDARHAIELICGAPVTTSPHAAHPEVRWAGNPERPTEVRHIDNRAGDSAERNHR